MSDPASARGLWTKIDAAIVARDAVGAARQSSNHPVPVRKGLETSSTSRQRVLYWNSCGPGDVRTPRVRARSSLSSRCRAGRSITDSHTCTAGSAATRPRSGRGIDRQLEDCLAIAGKRGWRARDWYSDYDRSAWSELGDRPDFDRRKKRGWRSHKDRYPLRVQVNLLATS